MSRYVSTERPSALHLQPDNLPEDLTRINRWLVWRYTSDHDPESGETSWDKPPLNAQTLRSASSTNPQTWTDWPTALSAYEQRANDLDGVGFVLHRAAGEIGPGLVGIDLDDCRDPETGAVEPWAAEEVRRFSTYTEVSPSGRGLRLFLWGELPPHGRKRGNVECYDNARYVTVTGHELPDSPSSIEHRQAQLDAFHAEHFPAEEPPRWEGNEAEYISPLTDLEIVEKAKASKNGPKFSSLWSGNVSGHNSRSEADLALCNHLAFFAGPDPNRIADLFAQSGLYRSKWNREDYRAATIRKALSGRTEFYGTNGTGQTRSNGRGPNSYEEYEQAHVLGAKSATAKNGEPEGKSGYRFVVMDSKAFADGEFKPTWLIKRHLVANQPAVIGAPKKTLKTSIVTDMALSLASGAPFLGVFDVYRRSRVVILSAESGQFTLQETANRICASKGISLADLGDSLVWGFDLPQLGNPTDLAELKRGLEQHKTDVVILDPTYLALLAGVPDVSASNLFQMGPLYRNIGKLCEDVGATPILVHHATKHFPTGEVMELDHLAYSGLAEFARQWLLLSRREPFDPGQASDNHKLWLSVGGSCGQSGLWGVDVDEGKLGDDFTGRTWDVVVDSSGDIRSEQAEKAEGKKDEKKQREIRADGTKFLAALDQLVELGQDRDGAVRYTTIRDLAGLSGTRANRAALNLLANRVIEKVDVEYRTGKSLKTVQHADGYRRPKRA